MCNSDTPLRYINLSVRLRNLCEIMGINNLGQLMQVDKKDFLKVRGAGNLTLNELLDIQDYYRKEMPKNADIAGLNWEKVRILAAIASLHGMVSTDHMLEPNTAASRAIIYADTLVQKLKGGKQ